MTQKIFGLVGLVIILLAGCVSPPVKEGEVTAVLPPMPQPEVDVGFTWTGLRNGKPFAYTIVSDSGDAWDWESSGGCKFTVAKTGFAPGKKWSNCEATDGQQTSTLTGEIWPLRVGKQWSFAFRGSNANGANWEGKRDCKVESTVKIETALGPQDTYKVVCRDKWNVRTFYISPELKRFVFWEWFRKNKNKSFRHEITAAN